MEYKDKIVEFHEWCHKCKFYKLPENDEPCETCLTDSVNEYSHKPTQWIEGPDVLKGNSND